MREHIGGAIAYLAWRKGISFSKLAARMGVPRSYPSKICNERQGLYMTTVLRFAEALGVSFYELCMVSRSREAYIFSNYMTREIAKNLDGSRKERNMIVRFINQHGKRRTAA